VGIKADYWNSLGWYTKSMSRSKLRSFDMNNMTSFQPIGSCEQVSDDFPADSVESTALYYLNILGTACTDMDIIQSAIANNCLRGSKIGGLFVPNGCEYWYVFKVY